MKTTKFPITFQGFASAKQLFLICIIGLLLLSACKVEQKQVPSAPIETPTAPAAEIQVAPAQAAPAAAKPTQLLSELKCINGKIEAVVANTKDVSLTLAKDIKIIINGLPPVSDPDCGKLVLAPGESTVCSDITGHYPVKEGKTNSIQLNLQGERVVEYVTCP